MGLAPKKGDRFLWHGLSIEVTRVSDTWVDIRVNDSWSKRMSLPLPDSFERVE